MSSSATNIAKLISGNNVKNNFSSAKDAGKIPAARNLRTAFSSNRKIVAIDSKSFSNQDPSAHVVDRNNLMPSTPPPETATTVQDFSVAWSYLKDDHNALFPGSLHALLDDLCITAAEDLQQVSDNLLVAVSATLKPAPKKKFLDAMQKSGVTVKI